MKRRCSQWRKRSHFTNNIALALANYYNIWVLKVVCEEGQFKYSLYLFFVKCKTRAFNYFTIRSIIKINYPSAVIVYSFEHLSKSYIRVQLCLSLINTIKKFVTSESIILQINDIRSIIFVRNSRMLCLALQYSDYI